MNIRKLRADEIECRVAQVTSSGALMLLLYKDARVDQRILDEVFGIYGWQRHHQVIDGNLYCTVAVRNPDTGEWIEKQDVGTESQTEKEKGQASDSFKRACFNLGIGRELYTAPTIWVKKSDYNPTERNGKVTTYDRFEVSEIGYDDSGNINHLVIFNKNTQKYVFKYNEVESTQEKEDAKKNAKLKDSVDTDLVPTGDKPTAAQMKKLHAEMERTGINATAVLSLVSAEKLEDLTQAQVIAVLNKFAKTRDKAK